MGDESTAGASLWGKQNDSGTAWRRQTSAPRCEMDEKMGDNIDKSGWFVQGMGYFGWIFGEKLEEERENRREMEKKWKKMELFGGFPSNLKSSCGEGGKAPRDSAKAMRSELFTASWQEWNGRQTKKRFQVWNSPKWRELGWFPGEKNWVRILSGLRGTGP